MTVTLTLPYPMSANRYWRSFVFGKVNPRPRIVPSQEAMKWKREMAKLAQAQGVTKPLSGRVRVEIDLYPQRPLDWQKRQRKHGAQWDDSVQCLDLDNVRKVLYDALKGVAFDDDRWIWEDSARRMEPDGEGRCVVTISQLSNARVQLGLIDVVEVVPPRPALTEDEIPFG